MVDPQQDCISKKFNEVLQVYASTAGQIKSIPVAETADDAEQEQPVIVEDPMVQHMSQIVQMLTTSKELSERAKPESEDSSMIGWACRLTKAVILRQEANKEEIKKQNVNRANMRRMIREMEEKEEKVDPSFRGNLKTIERGIATLKSDAIRMQSLLEKCVKEIFENLKK